MENPMRHMTRLVAAFGIGTTSANGQDSPRVIEYPDPTRVITISADARRLALGAEADFLRVSAILPRGDGHFIVVNSGSSELRFHDGSGRRYAVVGRRGEGPGEYQRITTAGWLSKDSIAVFDPGVRRVSILGPTGVFARSIPLRAPFEGGGSPTSMVPLRTGSLLLGYSEIVRMAPQPQPVFFKQRLFEYSTGGELRDTAGRSLTSTEHFIQATTPNAGGVAYWNLAYGRTMTLRSDSGTLLAGDGTDWSVERTTPGGVPITRYVVRRAVSPVTDADREAYGRYVLQGVQGPQRDVSERMANEMPFPARKPAYRRFEVDDSGFVWLETYPGLGDEQPVWVRIDTRGREAIAVRWPARFRPLAFRGSLAYGVWRDADDVEHVHVYSTPPR
jgi:hypothetical protein